MEVKAVPLGRPTLAINSIFLGLAWISVGLRVYTRLRIIDKFYAEDWFLLLALVGLLVVEAHLDI
jgi:hypothetical protein